MNFFFTMDDSGYDFGYLLKILTCSPMPAEEGDFFELLRTYFPCIYDIKYLMKSCKNLKGGLQELANDLQVQIYHPCVTHMGIFFALNMVILESDRELIGSLFLRL